MYRVLKAGRKLESNSRLSGENRIGNLIRRFRGDAPVRGGENAETGSPMLERLDP
jgi:hypothetical protein